MFRLPAPRCAAAAVLMLLSATPVIAQKPDYHRADVIRTAARYVFGTSVFPRFLEDSVRFWYTSSGKDDRGVTYVVDPARATRVKMFDNARLASSLSLAADTMIEPTKLPVFAVVDTGKTLEIRMKKKVFRCSPSSYKCEGADTIVSITDRIVKNGPEWAARSPDKKWDVFVYNYNLYARPSELTNAEAIAKRDSLLNAAKPPVVAANGASNGAAASAGAAKEASAVKAATPARTDSVELPKGSIALTSDGVEGYAYDNDQGGLFSGTFAPRFKPKRAPIHGPAIRVVLRCSGWTTATCASIRSTRRPAPRRRTRVTSMLRRATR